MVMIAAIASWSAGERPSDAARSLPMANGVAGWRGRKGDPFRGKTGRPRFGGDGVRANSLAPGVIERPGQPEEVKDIARRLAKIQRLGQAPDIAAMAALLMSDEGSYITGQIINIDGGVTMRA